MGEHKLNSFKNSSHTQVLALIPSSASLGTFASTKQTNKNEPTHTYTYIYKHKHTAISTFAAIHILLSVQMKRDAVLPAF